MTNSQRERFNQINDIESGDTYRDNIIDFILNNNYMRLPDILSELKSKGFKWARSRGCWQNYCNVRNVEYAKSLLKWVLQWKLKGDDLYEQS